MNHLTRIISFTSILYIDDGPSELIGFLYTLTFYFIWLFLYL